MTPHKQYRFAAAGHWNRCLTTGFVADGGSMVPTAPIGSHALASEISAAVVKVAVNPYGHGAWRHTGALGELGWYDERGERHGPAHIDEIAASSPRLVAGKHALWVFVADAIRRYDRETLQQERTIALADLGTFEQHVTAIIDIAADGDGGIWVLANAGNRRLLIHVDGNDCVGRRLPLPEKAGEAYEFGVLDRRRAATRERDTCGPAFVFLMRDRCRLVFLDHDGAFLRERAVTTYQHGGWATRLVTDGRNRIGVVCEVGADGKPVLPVFVLLDARGEPLHAPFETLFGNDPLAINDVGLNLTTIWFATSRGIFTLSGEADPESAATTALLLTPALNSPVGLQQGWSRAELLLDLPPGVALEVSYVSTSEVWLKNQADQLAQDDTITVEQRLDRLWVLLDGDETSAGPRTFSIEGTDANEAPVAVPLFETRDQWLWLRLRLDVPATAKPPAISELRVIYPEISLMAQLPLMFSEPRHDPEGTLRRLVGVLETTVQSIDRSIEGIGRQFEAGTASETWLDYLGRWVDMPWHDALPSLAKRRLLRGAGAITGQRGTRKGLDVLLRAILGPSAEIAVSDVTVDHQPARLGGAAMPALLGGRRSARHRLGKDARVGSVKLHCKNEDLSADNPLATILPTLRIRLTAPVAYVRAIAPLLPAILEQFVPLGVRVAIRWEAVPRETFDAEGEVVLVGRGPGQIGEDSFIGRTVLAGRAGRIRESGNEMGSELR